MAADRALRKRAKSPSPPTIGAAHASMHAGHATGWIEWEIPSVDPLADPACFNLDVGPPVLIKRPLMRAPPHEGWRDARAFLDFLECRLSDQQLPANMRSWGKPMIRVLARGQNHACPSLIATSVQTTSDTWLQTRKVDEIPVRCWRDAAYVQIYWGGRTAQLVVEDGAPGNGLSVCMWASAVCWATPQCISHAYSARPTKAALALAWGALPSCLQQRSTNRSLILFLSVSSTLSNTHFDETTSVLYCVAGVKIIYLCHPDAPQWLGQQTLPDRKDRLDYN
eukprot:1002571-Prymnesium_polylepis.1